MTPQPQPVHEMTTTPPLKNDTATQSVRQMVFPDQRARLFARLGIRSEATTASLGLTRDAVHFFTYLSKPL